MRFSVQDEKGGLRGSLLTLSVALLLAALAVLWARHYFQTPAITPPPQPTPLSGPSAGFQGDPAEATDRLLKALNQKLQDMDLLKLLADDVETHPATVGGKVFNTYREDFRVPLRYSADEIAGQLEATAKSQGARMQPNGWKGSYSFLFSPEWTSVEIAFAHSTKPRICLIIDDGGYQKGEALEALYGFKVPVTVSIIPDVEFSKDLAAEFPAHGVEVMCHMPMEGHEKGMVGGNYKELLKKGMGSDKAEAEVQRALENLPNCRGLNNHMGSLATEDPELIWGVCQALKPRGLFIIDSRTTAKSVVEDVARKAGVPVAHRNIFLDNMETPGVILQQLNQTAAYAKKHGLAVAIGHFKLTTLKTLEVAVHQLKDQGFQFVYASEVVK